MTAWDGGGTTTLRLEHDGAGTLTAYQNGVQVAQVVDASPLSGQWSGLAVLNAGDALWDDFAASGAASGRPLKVWDGTAWQTVACMVPDV